MNSVPNFTDERKSEGQEPAKVHYLPFQLCYNGKADIESRFNANIRKDPDNQVVETEFRGRPLKGCQVEFPTNYKGIIARVSPSSDSQKNDGDCKKQSFVIEKEFNEFTSWNWDKIPSAMDTPVRVMDWLQLAATFHKPEKTAEQQ